jgi:hypothetical protein
LFGFRIGWNVLLSKEIGFPVAELGGSPFSLLISQNSSFQALLPDRSKVVLAQLDNITMCDRVLSVLKCFAEYVS